MLISHLGWLSGGFGRSAQSPFWANGTWASYKTIIPVTGDNLGMYMSFHSYACVYTSHQAGLNDSIHLQAFKWKCQSTEKHTVLECSANQNTFVKIKCFLC